MKRRNAAMVWIDHEKAYDIVPQHWEIESLKMLKFSNKVIHFITDAMKNWKEI